MYIIMARSKMRNDIASFMTGKSKDSTKSTVSASYNRKLFFVDFVGYGINQTL